MKITRRGPVPSKIFWVGTCMQCKSEAEATQNELTNITHDQREKEPFSWEKCPVCGAGEGGYGGMFFHPKKPPIPNGY